MADLLIASVVAAKTMDKQENFINFGSFLGGSFLLSLMIVILAGALAWNCNKGESLLMRIIYTILAMIFGTMYLFYYVVIHVAVPQTYKALNRNPHGIYSDWLACTDKVKL